MSISYQFGDVDAHGAMIRSQAASLEAEHQSIVRDVLAAGDFWGGSGSVACQEFITQLGRNFQTIYEQANSHGQKVQTAGNNMAAPTPPSAAAGPDPSPSVTSTALAFTNIRGAGSVRNQRACRRFFVLARATANAFVAAGFTD